MTPLQCLRFSRGVIGKHKSKLRKVPAPMSLLQTILQNLCEF
uniref:Uncharacterized protein n=1 Tax=Arundo donax TaxID=35708 RepID=A0A0A9FC82_ARUDO